MKYEEKVEIQNHSLQWGLQILSNTVSNQGYIFNLNLKKYD